MPTLVAQPTRVQAAGTKPKVIEEYIGRVNTKTMSVSVAHMRSPQGWEEPGQTPEFEEFTLVLQRHAAGALPRGSDGRDRRPSRRRSPRRVGPVFHAIRTGSGLHRGMRAGVLDGHRPSRCLRPRTDAGGGSA